MSLNDNHGYSLWTRSHAPRARTRVALFGVPQLSASSLATLYEDLIAVNTLSPRDSDCDRFSVDILGTPETVSGFPITGTKSLGDTLYDCVIIPALYDDGCLSDPDYGPLLDAAQIAWLRHQHAQGARMSTVCSGAYILAETGLLDGQEAAMYTLYADAFATRYPKVKITTNKGLVVSGEHREIVTGGQSVYSADVSLYTIAHFTGPEIAMTFAGLYGRNWTEALHAAPQEAEALETLDDRMVALARHYMLTHMGETGVVGSAAALANLAPRSFARRFVRATGQSPQAYLAATRMARARDLLAGSRMPIEDIAAKVGYGDRTSFSKAFRARTGLPPAKYRLQVQGAYGLGDKPKQKA